MNLRALLVVAAALGVLSSCIAVDPYYDEVRDVGAEDLPCPRSEVDVCVNNARESRYCAYGCGRDREYHCGIGGCAPTLIDFCTCD